MAARTVRPALASDARAIAAVHVQAWRETYAHVMPADFLAALDVEGRADDNPRAEAFYRRNGFARDGAEAVRSFGPVDVRLVRLTR